MKSISFLLGKCFIVILLLISMGILFSCVTTQVSSIKNPMYDTIKYEKLIVMTHFSNIGLRQEIEAVFVEILKGSGIEAVRSIDVFPPYKEYNNGEFSNYIREHNFDGMIVVTLTGSDSDTSLTYTGQSFFTTTYDYFSFEIRLWDVRTDEVAWMATSNTTASEATDEMVVRSIADEVLKKFAEDYGLPYKNTYATTKPSS